MKRSWGQGKARRLRGRLPGSYQLRSPEPGDILGPSGLGSPKALLRRLIRPLVTAPDPHLSDEALAFLRERLGPASETRFGEPGVRARLQERLAAGLAVEDAVLGIAHGLARTDRGVADEFLGHFLDAMLRLGSLNVSRGLRRYLDTGDLVNSVAGDLWSELSALEFRTRREFLAWLGQRLRWKAADHARRLKAGRRREDLRQDREEERLSRSSQAGPSTLAGAQEERDRFILVLARLPARDRELLARHLRGESHREIADALGIQEAAARKALQRALEKARALLR